MANTAVNGLLPAGLAVAARGLLNSVSESLQSGSRNESVLWWWLGFGLVATFLRVFSRQLDALLDRRLRDRLTYRVNSDVLEHAAQLDVGFFDDPRFHDMLQRTRDSATPLHAFWRSLLRLGMSSIEVISLFAILVVIEPWVLPVFLGLSVPYAVFQFRLARITYALERSRAVRVRWSQYFTSQLTTAAAVAETRLLRLAPLFIARFRELVRRMLLEDWRLRLRGFAGSTTFGTIGTLAVYALFARVVFRSLDGSATIGDVAIFGASATALHYGIERLIASARGCHERLLFMEELRNFLGLTPEIPRLAKTSPPELRGELEIDQVRFRYPGTEDWVIDGLSLHIRAGETIALVGENGSGKTTLIKLIARLYDPQEGAIRCDGVDLRELSQEFLHSRVSFVFQGFGRYEATAAENIAYGDWERLLDDPVAVEEVAKRAGLEDLVRSLPDGLKTHLGRRFGEYELSSGQWQQLAMARAFAHPGSILIFDEPTSNLDARAEHSLFLRFRELAEARTTILVSHRFSTVAAADRIAVMEAGKIEELGSHSELMSRGGRYATLYRMQHAQLSGDAGIGADRSGG